MVFDHFLDVFSLNSLTPHPVPTHPFDADTVPPPAAVDLLLLGRDSPAERCDADDADDTASFKLKRINNTKS